MNRRDFLKLILSLPLASVSIASLKSSKGYAMIIDVEKCIGCGRCVIACKIENGVPLELPISRTWIEGYLDGKKIVMNTKDNPFIKIKAKNGFFVPKLCNHCSNAPCVNVCPVSARFHVDGIVLVNKDVCIGCKYCIIACPYGATFVHPEEKVTDKCTFCYHRIRRGLKPACVLVCPTGARKFGELKEGSEVYEILKSKRFSVLKPEAGTNPRVFYLNLDTVVE
ncbi:MAG: tetrathionate reductase [Archaeoglobi archaeon]|jgi:Fe-S-cluster-containing dehydrogenase component|nr:MAG: tetrathionate reductase [Archaeoglobi archaeon]